MHGRVDPQDHNQVDPALGEQVTGVPVDDAPALLFTLILYGIQQLSTTDRYVSKIYTLTLPRQG